MSRKVMCVGVAVHPLGRRPSSPAYRCGTDATPEGGHRRLARHVMRLPEGACGYTRLPDHDPDDDPAMVPLTEVRPELKLPDHVQPTEVKLIA